MRRTRRRSAWHGRLILTLVAAGIGYLIGNWNGAMVRGAQPPSAAEAVALRFPEDLNIAQPQPAPHVDAPAAAAMVLGPTQLALFEPEPMVPHPALAPPPAEPAAAEPAQPQPAPPAAAAAAAAAAPPKAAQLAGIPKSHPAGSHVANRPGTMLDDAQIASIKRRLHLTPEQEQMWPAVEAALRNIAFAKAREVREARRRDARPGAIDPNSAEVQDLKSAAIPLLMSFSSEQKDEVRNLAHVMGLDQLASQF
jgi:hypothetical protein